MQHLAVKAAVTETTDLGRLEAIAAAYSIDRTNEQIRRGAFKRTIAAWQVRDRPLPLHWDHRGESSNIIGSTRAAWRSERRACSSQGRSISKGAPSPVDELDLFEVSITPAPANADTKILSTKSLAPVQIARFEC